MLRVTRIMTNKLKHMFAHLLIPPLVSGPSMAASSRGPLSFGQADLTWLAVSAVAPTMMPTATMAVGAFTFEADWNWLVVAESLGFLVEMLSENLCVTLFDMLFLGNQIDVIFHLTISSEQGLMKSHGPHFSLRCRTQLVSHVSSHMI